VAVLAKGKKGKGGGGDSDGGSTKGKGGKGGGSKDAEDLDGDAIEKEAKADAVSVEAWQGARPAEARACAAQAVEQRMRLGLGHRSACSLIPAGLMRAAHLGPQCMLASAGVPHEEGCAGDGRHCQHAAHWAGQPCHPGPHNGEVRKVRVDCQPGH